MTLARAHTVSADQHGMYHCVTRCVHRAWLCGVGPLTGQDHDARKPMIVNRIRELGEIYAVAAYAYAVMINHLHVVLSVAMADLYRKRHCDVSWYWRIAGGAEAIMDRAHAIGQTWMKGIGYVRWLEKLS